MKTLLVWIARLFALLIVLGCAPSLHASTFDFTFSGTGISVSGSLTATLISGNDYLVNSINGMQNSMAITLLAPGTYGDNDNNVFSSGPALDVHGLGFSIGSTDYNIYYDASLSAYFECSSAVTNCHAAGDGTQLTSGSLTATPEPSSLLLLGTGLLGLGPLIRRFSRI